MIKICYVLCLIFVLGTIQVVPQEIEIAKRYKRQIEPPPPPCPSSWTTFNGKCYQFELDQLYTWNQANETCLGLGSNLVSIHNMEENEFIMQKTAPHTGFWIGLYQPFQGAPHEWVDRSPTDYFNWKEGEPNRLYNDTELCVEFRSDKNGVWNDLRCNFTRKLVCVKQCLTSTTCKNGGTCSRGSCLCRYGFLGVFCEEVLESYPVMHNAQPSVGPASGGTHVTVIGTNIPTDIPLAIYLGNIECTTKFRDSNMVKCTTPKLTGNQASTLGKQLQVLLIFSDGTILDARSTFIFKRDPVVQSITPGATIYKGGTHLTVLGENFDTISKPRMVTLVKYTNVVHRDPLLYDTELYSIETECFTGTNEQMLCLTPFIQLPKGFIPTETVSNKPKSIEKNDDGKTAIKIEASTNGDKVDFGIGFVLDGVYDFKSFTSIGVFTEPWFDISLCFIDYKPGREISLKGYDLDIGVTVDDYRIRIGDIICANITLQSTSLSCYPPEFEDEGDGSYPKIVIHIGTNIKHFAGYLRNSNSVHLNSTAPTPDTEQQRCSCQIYLIVPVTVASIVVVVAIVVVIVLCIKQRRNAPSRTLRENNKEGELEETSYETLQTPTRN